MAISSRSPRASVPLELWAGAECSVVRVGDLYFDEVDRTGHATRISDLDRLAALGVRAVRCPVLWERTAPRGLASAAFDWPDARLERLVELGVRPIVGLVHHGSGPRGTSLLDPSFASGLAAFARAVAERYPFVRDFTPVNEPLTTARFAGLYGHWYPHARSEDAFLRALLVECEATRAAMKAIREVIPDARLVQTEDMGTVLGTEPLTHQWRYENERLHLGLDLLVGRVDERHPFWAHLLALGAREEELRSFVAAPCPPDVIGVNYYVTSDRFLDHRVSRYPGHVHGGNGTEHYADVEAVRVRAEGIVGHEAILRRLWARYALPLAITEVHVGCTPEEQIRWLLEAWNAARAARRDGIDVRAVTLWSAFGALDWDSLLTASRDHYEPGAFDVRGGVVRPTALAAVAEDLARAGSSSHPALAAPGWWRKPGRLTYPAVGTVARSAPPARMAPVVVTGAHGTLGRAFVRICEERGFPVVALGRADLDVTDEDAVSRALATFAPWLVVNAAGYVRVDDAEHEPLRCWRANTRGAVALGHACATHAIRFVTFSSDLVFDGAKSVPYVESDRAAPLSVYGASKAEAERRVLAVHPEALVVRTSAFFGPWDPDNFVERAARALQRSERFVAADDLVVSPTYVPDLAHATLTLAIDGARGLWHVANPHALSWADLARAVARTHCLPESLVEPRRAAELGLAARRPTFSALASERGALLGSLEEALARHAAARSVRSDAA